MQQLQPKSQKKTCAILECNNEIIAFHHSKSNKSILVESKYCEEHTCIFEKCANLCVFQYNYKTCLIHTIKLESTYIARCAFEKCTNPCILNKMKTCLTHTCEYNGCREMVKCINGKAHTLCFGHTTIDPIKYKEILTTNDYPVGLSNKKTGDIYKILSIGFSVALIALIAFTIDIIFNSKTI